MAQRTSRASLILRVALVLVLVVMIGALVFERRAAANAQAAFGHAKEVAASRKDAAALQQLLGRAPDADGPLSPEQQVREQRFVYKGVIRNYTVRVLFNPLDKGEQAEEAHLDVFNKLKGEQEVSETAAQLPSVGR